MKKILLFLCLLSMGCSADPDAKKKLQDETAPVLICTKHNVQVWMVYNHYNGQRIYFTTPSGDVEWSVPGNDDNLPVRKQVISGVKGK